MRHSMIIAAFALASCAPAADEAKTQDAGGFAVACKKTYAAAAEAGLTPLKGSQEAAAARLAAGMIKTRAPKICGCAERTLSETLDERGLAIAAELMPLRFAHDIARAGGDRDAARLALEETRAEGFRMIGKYSLTTAEMNKIAATTDMAIASCFAPSKQR